MSPRAPAAFLEHAQPFLKAGVLDASDVHAIALTAPRFGEDDVERMLGLAFAARAPRGKLPSKARGMLPPTRPDGDVGDRKTGSISLGQGMGDLATAQQQKPGTLWPRQIACGEQAGRCRAPVCQFAAIQHGKWHPGGSI